MKHVVVSTALLAILSVLLFTVSYRHAEGQERATCSQALAACGKQRVCLNRYHLCMRTGCWNAFMINRCGYVKQ